jgi:glycosyltransferase involved in cell wall biosynthesis
MNKLTVVTYLHENERHFDRCIKGIKSQSFKDFEWWILTHKPLDINLDYPHKLVLLSKELNTKSAVLNYALPLIQTPYFALNDSDDRPLPNRFEVQVAFMDKNPEIDICSAMFFVNETDFTWPMHEKSDMITSYMIINSPMANSLSIFRNKLNLWGREVAYNTQYLRAQDYDLWFQCLKKGLRFHNIQEPLMSYFASDAKPHDNSQEQNAIKIRNQIHEYAGLKLVESFEKAFNNFALLRLVDYDELILLLNFLLKQNFKKPFHLAKKAIAWQLKLYIVNHGLQEDKKLEALLMKLETQNGFLSRILGR